jgi:hypothetical protein
MKASSAAALGYLSLLRMGHRKMAMDVRRSMQNYLAEQSWLMKPWGYSN